MSIKSIPVWLRRFVVDTIETLVPTLIVMNFMVPRDVLVPAVISAVGAAALSAARRNMTDFNNWLHGIAGYDEGK